MPAVGLVQDPHLAAAAVDRVDGLLGMARRQQDLQVWPQAGGLLRKLGSEHAAGHYDIGEQKVDLLGPAQYVVVLDNENGFAAAGLGLLTGGWRGARLGRCDAGEEQPDGGAVSRFGA